jgi:hypothetical protein
VLSFRGFSASSRDNLSYPSPSDCLPPFSFDLHNPTLSAQLRNDSLLGVGVRRRNVHVLCRGLREHARAQRRAVVDSVRAYLRMDRISHPSELGQGQSPVRSREIFIRLTPLPPLLLYSLYMSLLKLLSRPTRCPPSRRLLPPTWYACSYPYLCSHIKEA